MNSKLLVAIGIVALIHAAVSATQHKSWMRLHQSNSSGQIADDEGLPFDIVIEALIGFCITCYGAVKLTSALKDIRPEGEFEDKTTDSLSYRPSFMVFGGEENLYDLDILSLKSPISQQQQQQQPLDQGAESGEPAVDQENEMP